MRVAVVTNEDERCGNGEYGRNLTEALRVDFDVDVMLGLPDVGRYGAVVINYHAPCIPGFSLDTVRSLQQYGTKVVFILQESWKGQVHASSHDTMCVVDAVVAHEPMQVPDTVRLCVIPHGAPRGWETVRDIYTVDRGPSVGTAGFAFPAKRMDITARASARIGGRAVIVAPAHHTHNPIVQYTEWSELATSGLTLVTGWVPEIDVIRELAHCAMTVYFAQEDWGLGQSGSARLILAAGRPTIMRRYSKTSALFQYADEIYFVEHESEVYATAEHIWSTLLAGGPVKRPSRVLQDIGWETVGKMYRDLVRSVTNVQAVSA